LRTAANRSGQLLADIRAGVGRVTTLSVAVHKNFEIKALLGKLNFGLIDAHQRVWIGRVVRKISE
jgi:hypothetical protein